MQEGRAQKSDGDHSRRCSGWLDGQLSSELSFDVGGNNSGASSAPYLSEPHSTRHSIDAGDPEAIELVAAHFLQHPAVGGSRSSRSR